jgi:hypothetical protein
VRDDKVLNPTYFSVPLTSIPAANPIVETIGRDEPSVKKYTSILFLKVYRFCTLIGKFEGNWNIVSYRKVVSLYFHNSPGL